MSTRHFASSPRFAGVQRLLLVVQLRGHGTLNKTSPARFRLYFRTSHKTSLLGSRVKGSLNILTGIKNMSLLEPSDWPVLDPSKFHSGRSAGGIEIKVF